jgi:Metallo-beta-lactamase superfamily
MTDQSTSLSWDVFVVPSELLSGGDSAPGEKQAFWSPVSATLISGDRDAVLVDALLTVGQANDLAEWIAATGKNLTAVYITHGHGDHWFGLGTVLARFPNAQAFALPPAIAQARYGSTPEFLHAFWNSRFADRLPRNLVFPEPLKERKIELECHELLAIELPHTDTDHTSQWPKSPDGLGEHRAVARVPVRRALVPAPAAEGRSELRTPVPAGADAQRVRMYAQAWDPGFPDPASTQHAPRPRDRTYVKRQETDRTHPSVSQEPVGEAARGRRG